MVKDGTCVGDGIYINKNTEYPFEMVGRHELLHLLKRRNADPYRILREEVIYAFYPQLFQSVIEDYASLTNRHYGETGLNQEVAIEEILANLSYDIYTDNLPGYVADAEEARKIFDNFFDSYKNKELPLESRGGNKNGVKSEKNRFNGGHIDASESGYGTIKGVPRNEDTFEKNGEVWNYGTENNVRGSQKENSGNRSENGGDGKQYAIAKDTDEEAERSMAGESMLYDDGRQYAIVRGKGVANEEEIWYDKKDDGKNHIATDTDVDIGDIICTIPRQDIVYAGMFAHLNADPEFRRLYNAAKKGDYDAAKNLQRNIFPKNILGCSQTNIKTFLSFLLSAKMVYLRIYCHSILQNILRMQQEMHITKV